MVKNLVPIKIFVFGPQKFEEVGHFFIFSFDFPIFDPKLLYCGCSLCFFADFYLGL